MGAALALDVSIASMAVSLLILAIVRMDRWMGAPSADAGDVADRSPRRRSTAAGSVVGARAA
jgi:hypothetical protein